MKKENIFAILIALVVLIFINLPIFYFFVFHQSNLVFLGRRSLNPEDTYPLVSLIEQAKQGKILFANLYTSEVQIPSLFMPSYLLIGSVAALFNISSIAAFQGARIIFSILLFFVIYKFLYKFFDKPNERLLAFIIVLTSSGFGFLLNKIASASSDLWMPGSNTFLTLEDAPYIILSQILMMSGFYLFLNFIEKKKVIYIVGSSILFLFLSFEYPFSILVTAPTILFTCILSGLPIFKSVLIFLVSSFGIVNFVIEMHKDTFIKFWQSANILQSPSPTSYLAGYGLLIILALVGIEQFMKKNRISEKLIVIWVFFCIALLYLPFTFQGRMINGLHIPISILATCGLIKIISMIKKPWSKVVIITSLIILALTPVYSVVRDFENIAKESPQVDYFFISKPEIQALNWLKNQTNSNDIILANWTYGNIIPGITGRKVFLGHQFWTVSFEQKVQLINTLLLNNNPTAVSLVLKENGITYIFLGINDSMITYGFKPESEPFLQKVYSKDGVSIYKVIPY